MKNGTKYLLCLLLSGLLLSVSGCVTESTENSGTGTEAPELRTFLFQSADEAESISDEVFQKFIDEHCAMLIEASNTWDGETGSRTRDEEVIYCGENDYYVEYSIPYTELRTYYNNRKLVTFEIPRAHRRCFLKNELSVKNGDWMGPVYFGELTLEKVKTIGDFYGSVNSIPSIYRNVQDIATAYVDTNYLIYIVGGDYGLCDEAVLSKVDKYYDKTTHEITYTEMPIKSVEIPGTENYNFDVW